MEHREIIGEVRGKGLMIGVELVRNRKTKEPFAPADPIHGQLMHGARHRGAVIRVNAGKIIISPPLTFTDAHADQATAMLDDLLAEIVKK